MRLFHRHACTQSYNRKDDNAQTADTLRHVPRRKSTAKAVVSEPHNRKAPDFNTTAPHGAAVTGVGATPACGESHNLNGQTAAFTPKPINASNIDKQASKYPSCQRSHRFSTPPKDKGEAVHTNNQGIISPINAKCRGRQANSKNISACKHRHHAVSVFMTSGTVTSVQEAHKSSHCKHFLTWKSPVSRSVCRRIEQI